MPPLSPPKPKQRRPFVPRADAVVLTTAAKVEALSSFPDELGAALDEAGAQKPVDAWSEQAEENFYPPKSDHYAPSYAPGVPKCMDDRYLRAFLAKNEMLRVSMVWYYTTGILENAELMSGLQEKACLARESSDWEMVVIGILDLNFFMRAVTIGLPLGFFPRGEALASHTATRPPGSLFHLPNLAEDWRFRESPLVECGGLRAYAGAPLRLRSESGEYVGLGSLCVASRYTQRPLNSQQQNTLLHLADWIVADIVQAARIRRQCERRRMVELIAGAERQMDQVLSEEAILEILGIVYPDASIGIQSCQSGAVHVEGREPIAISDLEATHGVYEDLDYLDEYIVRSNHQHLSSDRVIRVLYARCDRISGPSMLIVGRKDFRLVLDDIDTWFVYTCAAMLTKMWHKQLLAEALTAKEKFLRGITHQLRTPIHGILGSVDLLAEEIRSPSLRRSFSLATTILETTAESPRNHGDEHALYLDSIKAAARDLIYIVNSMITLNRWTELAVEPRNFSMHTIQDVEAAMATFVAGAVGGDGRYQTTVVCQNTLGDHRDTTFLTDLELLRDCVGPLILNAIQHTSAGLSTVTTSLSPLSSDQFCTVVIDIEDNGQGIPLQDQERIFEPFEKVDMDSHHAGLGLPLAVRSSKLLNGDVTLVTSCPGKGSHFRATFRDVECKLDETPRAWPKSTTSHRPSAYHILSSRDKSLLTYHFAKFLQTYGYTESSRAEHSFILLQSSSMTEGTHRLRNLNVSTHTVAICLIATTETKSVDPWTLENVVYLSGPFTTSKFEAALEVAGVLYLQSRTLETSNGYQSSGSGLAKGPEGLEPASQAPSTTQPPHQPVQIQLDNFHFPSTDDSVRVNDAGQPLEETFNPHGSPRSLGCRNVGQTFPATTSVSKPTALLVDDNAINLRVLQMYCKKRQLDFKCATDGQKAVEVFEECQSCYMATGEPSTPVRLILMDLQMPICDGVQATKQIRSLEREKGWQRSVLLMVTGQDNTTDRAAAEEAGADDYLVKPLSIERLDIAVGKYFPAFTQI